MTRHLVLVRYGVATIGALAVLWLVPIRAGQ